MLVNVRTVETYKTSVHHKFHVRSPGGFSTGGGDVLANVRGRHDDLTLADIVVLEEDDLDSQSVNFRV